MKFKQENLKEYISLKLRFGLLKKSDLYKTDLKTYITRSMDYARKLKLLETK